MDPNDNDKETSTSPVFDSSQSTRPASPNFLDLPKLVRDKIYEGALIILHPLYIFSSPGIPVEVFGPDTPNHWLALIYTNRQISAEASAVLYRVNHFELVDITRPQIGVLRSFLDCIGPANANSLSYLCISFPIVVNNDEEPGEVKIRDDSLQIVEILRNKCTKLSTLETTIHYKNSGFFKKSDQFLQQAFLYLDAQLKTIYSLQNIVVRIDTQNAVPTTSTKEMMHQLGWLVLSGS